MKSSTKCRRGIGALIAMAFLTLILASGLVAYMYIDSVTSGYHQTMLDMNQLDNGVPYHVE